MMYDTSMSSSTGGGGGGGGASWSSRSASGGGAASGNSSAASYNYFPRSHPGNTSSQTHSSSSNNNNNRHARSPAAQRPASKLLQRARPRIASTASSSSLQFNNNNNGSSSSKPATSPKSMDQQSWASAPPMSPVATAAAQYTSRLPSPSTHGTTTTTTPTSSSSPRGNQLQTPLSTSSKLSHGSRTTSPARSSASGGGGGYYRQDYSRSQHSSEQHKALTEPILTEQDRFAAYVNRFAQVDPRTTSYTTTTSPKHGGGGGGGSPTTAAAAPMSGTSSSMSMDRGGYRVSPKAAGASPTNSGGAVSSPSAASRGNPPLHPVSPLDQKLSASLPPKSGGGPSPSSSNAAASAVNHKKGVPFHRQLSTESAAATVSSSTSSIFKRKVTGTSDEEPGAATPNAGSSSSAAGTIELEARTPATSAELQRTLSDMGRTTSSAATRRTRPSASRYRVTAAAGASTTSSVSHLSGTTNNTTDDDYEEEEWLESPRSPSSRIRLQQASPPPPTTIVESTSSLGQQPSEAYQVENEKRNGHEEEEEDRYASMYGDGEKEELDNDDPRHEQPRRDRGSVPETSSLTGTENSSGIGRVRSPASLTELVHAAEPTSRTNNMDYKGRARDPTPESTTRRSSSLQRSSSGAGHHRQVDTALSATPVGDDSSSPGANRTRDLAKRFEQRMQSKGRSSQLLKSAMHSAYQQQQQTLAKKQHQQVHRSSQDEDTRPTQALAKARSADSGDADEKKETEEMMGRVHPDGAIETPLPARVKELKEKLWDDQEYLQVRVPPTLPYHGEDCHRSPQNSPAAEMNIGSNHRGQMPPYYPSEHSHPQSPHGMNPESSSAPRGRMSMDAFSTTSSPSSAQYSHNHNHQQSQQNNAYRQTRSLSPRTSRKPYNSLAQPPLSHNNNNQSATKTQPERTTASDAASFSGSTGSGHRFKSKFYEAAALASPEWSQGGGAPGKSETSTDEKPLGAKPLQPPTSHYHLHPAHKSAWMKNKAKTSESEVPHSQASTPKITNEHNVSVLLRKLHSINRQDPSQALAEIDEILKQEALKDDPTLQRALRVTDEEYLGNLQQIPPNGQFNDDESDSETTISSITNPTYQGHQSNYSKKDVHTSPLGESAPIAEIDESGGDQKPEMGETTPPAQNNRNTLSDLKAAAHDIDDTQALERLSRTPNSSRPPLAPQPQVDPGMTNQEQQEANGRGMHPAQAHGYAEKSTGGERLRLDDLCRSNSEELASKIKRWDELSARDSSTGSRNKQGAGGGMGGEDHVSNATEDLGSIVTPMEQQQQVPQSPRPKHPWEANPPTRLLDTTMQSAEGVEAVELEPAPPSPKPQRDRPVRLSPVNTEKMMNMSNDFDDAWVALPTSRFFQSPASPERRPKSKSPHRQRSPAPRKPFSPIRSPEKTPSSSAAPSAAPRKTREELPPTTTKPSRSTDVKPPTGAYDQERIDQSHVDSDFVEDSAEETTGLGAEGTGTKPKRRLRALLQRGRDKSGQASASVTNGSIAASTRRSVAQSEDEEALTSRNRNGSRSNTNNAKDGSTRGRVGRGEMDGSRSRSLEERRVRNPNIARKFSRMLRVYGDDDKAYV